MSLVSFLILIWENIPLDCDRGLALDFFECTVLVEVSVRGFPLASRESSLECPGTLMKEQLAKAWHLMNFDPRSHF